jgi:hypothetical protein
MLPTSLSYAIWINHTRREYVVFRDNDIPLLYLFQMARGRWHFVKDTIVTHVRHMFDDYAMAPVGHHVNVDAFWPKLQLSPMLQFEDAFLYTEHLREAYEFGPPITHETYFTINRDNMHRLTAAQLSYVDALKQRTASPDAPAVSFDEAMFLMLPYLQEQVLPQQQMLLQ